MELFEEKVPSKFHLNRFSTPCFKCDFIYNGLVFFMNLCEAR